METEVTVNDPVYVVRRRLGKMLSGADTREEEIENMEAFGKEIDEDVSTAIREDYREEIEDSLSDMEDNIGIGDQVIGGQNNNKNKIDKYMRVSSLQMAFKAYPVFKSIVVN